MENQNNYIAKVRESYIPHERTKLDELKELDKKVRTPALIFAYAFGTVAALILGVGMCLAMRVIGADVMPYAASMAVGVIVGCAGIGCCAANYFIYKAVLNSRKKKYGGKIIALSKELLNG
ncbi:MAG: dihydropteridine reductase [Clostridia bacterium]|nr:dihydropteridine reductase [Clostridia bacterium]